MKNFTRADFDKFAQSQINPLTNQPWTSGEEMLSTIKEKVADINTREAFGDIFNGTIQNLALLVIRQSLENSDSPTEAQQELLNRIPSRKMKENGEKLIKKLMTGHTTFADSTYIPTGRTAKKVESHDVIFYQRNSQGAIELSQGAYQFKKETDIRPIDWVPHLLDGTLNKYIADLAAELGDAYSLFKFNALATQITTSSNYRKKVAGVAKDVYEVQNELIAIIRQMVMKKTMFNKDRNSKYLNKSVIDDIIIVVPSKFQELRISGVWPQLFNPQYMNGVSFKLSEANILCLENQITIGTQDEVVSDSGNEWVADNTIYILDKKELRHFLMFEKSASQFFASNVLEYIVLHVWGKIDVSPWFKGVIYTNNNLLKLPNGSVINPTFTDNPDVASSVFSIDDVLKEDKEQESTSTKEE